MSSDVGWHIRDKLWPMPKHGSTLLYVHRNRGTHLDVYPTDSAIEAVLVGCIRVVGDRISDCCRNLVREANHAAQYNQRFSPSESYGKKSLWCIWQAVDCSHPNANGHWWTIRNFGYSVQFTRQIFIAENTAQCLLYLGDWWLTKLASATRSPLSPCRLSL